MATCDSLQPVVLLTDVMDSGINDAEMVFPQNSEEQNSNSQLFQLEQTEPLNLCLNGGTLNDFVMIECAPKCKEDGKLGEQNEEDVIFVKEFKVNYEKQQRRSGSQKIGAKGEPRRNPIRKARDTKRFKEYTDGEFYDEEFLNESTDEENCVDDLQEKFIAKSEDSEDWKIERVSRKTRQRRRVISRKLSHKLGRKRKFHKIEEEKKVKLEGLEPLVQSNLLLIRDYVKDIKAVKDLLKNEDATKTEAFKDVTKNAVSIFKQQIILLTIVKKIDENDLTECVKDWINS